MRKLLSLVLVLIMLFSAVSCSKSSDKAGKAVSEGDTGDTIGLTEKSGEVNQFGYEIPKETITFTVYAGYGDQAEFDEKSAWAKEFWKENFNIEFNILYYGVDMVEKLNFMLASNDYPEAITNISDEMANKFAAQGRALELTPYIEKYGPNITRRLGKYLNMYKTDDGKLYKLPKDWGETPNVAGWDAAVRYDYLIEANLPVYKTPEEYYQTLKKLLELHPTTENGEKVYALSSNDQGANFYNAMLAAYGFKNGFKVDEETGEFTHWINTPEGLEIAKYINRFYREGMIDPDYANNKFEDWQAKVANDRIIGHLGTWWHVWVAGHEYWAQMEGDDYDINKRFINVTILAPGVEKGTHLASNFLGSSRFILTDKCKQPENYIDYLNWEYSELGTFVTAFGPPSPDNVWDIDEEGNWIFKESTFDNAKKNENFHAVIEKFGAKSFWLSTSGGWMKTNEVQNFDKIDKRLTRVSTWDYWPINEDGTFMDEGVQICWENVTQPAWDSTLYTVTFDPEDPITQVNQTIRDTLPSEWAKIMEAATEEACEEAFMAAREKLNSLGLHDLEKFYAESYQKNKAKFDGN